MIDCKRCKWKVIAHRPIEKKGPTGHPSGRYGIWETRVCVNCQSKCSRYKPGIDESTRRDIELIESSIYRIKAPS